jgi:hypothetical protein
LFAISCCFRGGVGRPLPDFGTLVSDIFSF